MGQSYKGAEASFIDNAMFKLPYELMAQVIEKKDKGVQQDLDSAVALKDKLKAQALKVDQPALKQKILDYTQRIDDITAGIKGNVMDYSRFSDQTNQLSRDITQDWTMGDIYTMESNRTGYLENVKELEDAYKKDPSKFRAGQLEALKAAALSKYQGYKNPETGEYNTYTNATLYGTEPLTEHVDKAMKGTVGEFEEIERDSESGMWRTKTHGKWQGWKPLTELKPIWESYLSNNPNIALSLNQIEELGLGNRKQEETKAFDYLFNKYSKRQVLDSTSKTLSEVGKLEKAQELQEPDQIVVQDKVIVTGNTATAGSLYASLSQSNSQLGELKQEIGANIRNTVPQKTREAILKGDPVAIKAYFSDPETAEKYINQFEALHEKRNLAIGSINSYNHGKPISKQLPTNVSKWTTKQREDYNIFQNNKGVKLVNEVEGVFKFPDNTKNVTIEKYQTTAAESALNGQMSFKMTAPGPSIKYGGATFQTYDPSNPASKSTVKGNMKVHYGGRDYWYNVSPNYWNKDIKDAKSYPTVNIGGKQISLKTVGLKNVVMYEPVEGGIISAAYLTDNGHVPTAQNNYKGSFQYNSSATDPGTQAGLVPDKKTFIPSTIKNQKGDYVGVGKIRLGTSGEGYSIEYDASKYSTQEMLREQDSQEKEASSRLTREKARFNDSYVHENFAFRRGRGSIINGKFYLESPEGKVDEITNKELKEEMYRVSTRTAR